jgi:hypothetical protein
MLAELPALTIAEGQAVIRAVELDEPELSDQDELLVQSRLAGHREGPNPRCRSMTRRHVSAPGS